nr:topless-related protein 4-like isoform X1 [Ipomoea batatas]
MVLGEDLNENCSNSIQQIIKILAVGDQVCHQVLVRGITKIRTSIVADGGLPRCIFEEHCLYSYSSNNELQNHLEIEAYVGNVNDLAFSSASQPFLAITCVDDKMIKFILSTDVDGKIKLWAQGEMNSIANYDAPGYACTRMTYSADGKRTSIVADGGLPASPCIRFNKGGTLLAVRTSDNGLKILANVEGVSLPLVVMYLILCSTLKIN